MKNHNKKVGIGIGVMLLKNNKILLGLRNPDPKKADSELHGEGTWTMPGGKIHFGETWGDAAYREVFEETGIKMNKESLEIVCVNDDILPDVHYVTIGLLCKDFKGKPQSKEPEEILEWKWFELDKLPQNIYEPSRKITRSFLKTNKSKSLFTDLNVQKFKEFYNPSQKLIFTSIPSPFFYLRGNISAYVLNCNKSLINPYLNFDYNLMNVAEKKSIRTANNSIINKVDELWVFTKDLPFITDGVLFEVNWVKKLKKRVRFFRIINDSEFREIDADINWPIEGYYGTKLTEQWPLIYTAMSSKLFQIRYFISKFVLDIKRIPINPFLNFDYFLLDKTDRDKILVANSTLIKYSDQLWVFGPISDGVLAEIKLAKYLNKPIRYFKIINGSGIKKISKNRVEFEEGLEEYKNEL